MPASFGKYEVVEKIGEGGFGEVFRGRDPQLKRFVAIKTCKSTHRELRERFVREAEVSAALQHPNITTVFDFGDAAGTPYLVQEFLEGEDLSTAIRDGTAGDFAERMDVLAQIAAGLAHAHERGVVHRDLKPGNVRRMPDGRVKIMDFGIAKLLQAEQQLTRVGMTMGTAGYLPPEQLLGEEIDHRADIFSFGVLTYELMTGRRPFEGDNVSTIFYRIAHEEPPPMTEVWRDCPPRLWALVARCLAKRREDRWGSFDQVLAALDGVREAVAASREAETELAPAARLAAPAAVPVTALPGATLPNATLRGATVPPPAVPARSESFAYRTAWPGGGRRGLLLAAVAALLLAVGLAAWWRGSAAPTPAVEAAAFESAAVDVPAVEVAATAPETVPAPPVAEQAPASSPAMPAAATAVASASGTRPPPPTVAPGATPVPLAPVPLAPGARVLVLFAGDGSSTAAGAFGEELLARGFRVVTGTAEASDPVAEARRSGAPVVVSGRLEIEATPSVGRFYTGRGVLELRILLASSGELVAARTVQVGGGGIAGELQPSELTARTAAAGAVARRAATVVADALEERIREPG